MLKIPPNQKTSQVTEKMDPKYTIGRYYTWSTRTQLAIVFCHELPTSSTATTFYPVFCGEHGCSKVVQLFLLLPKKIVNRPHCPTRQAKNPRLQRFSRLFPPATSSAQGFSAVAVLLRRPVVAPGGYLTLSNRKKKSADPSALPEGEA